MPRTRPAYPAEFRRQMVELVRAGRSPDELAKEFEPWGQSIREWVRRVDQDDGRRGEDGLNSAEREELKRLRRMATAACAVTGATNQTEMGIKQITAELRDLLEKTSGQRL